MARRETVLKGLEVVVWVCLMATVVAAAGVAAGLVTGRASGRPGAPKVQAIRADGAFVYETAATTTTTSTTAPPATDPPATTAAPTTVARPVTSAPRPPAAAVRPAPGSTACTAVAHIGDSLSVAMTSERTAHHGRMEAHYRRVGVADPLFDVSGGRSVVERVRDQANGYAAALRFRESGFRGCWVVALGTNDAANVAKGSSVGIPRRIQQMMSVIGSDPVLWINVRTTATSGWYAAPNMLPWNRALLDAAPAHPNMRIMDWAAVSHDSWYASDGIHQTAAGSANRASLTADALAEAFPASRPA